MSALQLWLQNHSRRLTQDAIDEALMEYITHVEKRRDELLADVERCYRMLLSEPDTQGALFKAENILREAIASVKEK